MGKLDGKVALISGGARGQGAAEAETFAREGAKVVFGDIRDAEGKKVEAAIRAAGGEAVYVHLDVTSEADWQGAVQTAVEPLRQARHPDQQRGDRRSRACRSRSARRPSGTR